MRIDELFPPEVIDEDIRKWAAGAAAGALAFAPALAPHHGENVPKLPISQEMKATHDVSMMAQTMWGEARNEGIKGMIAVGNVIMNRVNAAKDGMFGSGISGVALKSKQFSCWNKSDPNFEHIQRMRAIEKAISTKTPLPPYKNTPGSYEDWFKQFRHSQDWTEFQAWQQAYALAQKIIAGGTNDPTAGATYYHTSHVHPEWARKMHKVGKYAGHIFYKTPGTQKS